jgi:serine/threonine protein kinase
MAHENMTFTMPIESTTMRTMTTSTTMLSTKFGTTMRTLLPGQRELTVPAFLEYDFNRDIKQGQQIKKGGGGEIFKARPMAPVLIGDARNGEVVVKVVNDIPGYEKEVQMAFQQEVALMYFFRDNPYFAKLFGYTSTPRSIIMKMYPMGALSAYIHKAGNSYSKTIVVSLIKDLAGGLKAMHENGFAHCDIKPDNILLEVDRIGRIRGVLTDFGITQVVDSSRLLVRAFTKAQIEGGSVFYAAPEVIKIIRSNDPYQVQFSGQMIIMRDVYSAAVVLYELITRRAPVYFK